MAKAQGWDIEAVLNNDIVGGDKSPGQDPHTVRVFSEGIPINASESELKLIRALGGENDGASRQLARYIASISKEYIPAKEFQPLVVFRRDRYLRGGDHTSFNEQGFAAVRFTEFRENYDHQHQNVRTENGVEYGDLPKFVDYGYVANVARLNAATLASRARAGEGPVPRFDILLLGLGPMLGGLMLFGIGIKAAFYYGHAENVSSKPILGITLPLWMGIGGMLLGVVIMLISRPFFPDFFKRKTETAPPGLLDQPPPTGPVPAAVDF